MGAPATATGSVSAAGEGGGASQHKVREGGIGGMECSEGATSGQDSRDTCVLGLHGPQGLWCTPGSVVHSDRSAANRATAKFEHATQLKLLHGR